jgi:hypothetical protein
MQRGPEPKKENLHYPPFGAGSAGLKRAIQLCYLVAVVVGIAATCGFVTGCADRNSVGRRGGRG